MDRILIILLMLSSLAVANDQETVVVQTLQGKVRGAKLKTKQGSTYYSFTKIPYAKPPVGQLRYKDPEPTESWEGVLDALEPSPIAPQISPLMGITEFSGDEDCLFLNVYTPQNPEDETTNPKPVMVYIHPGGYYVGSGNHVMFGPGRFMNKGEVVVVTMNYRLGVLGFLSTGDSVIPGNFGLKDQVLSLKWVQENIAKFGGDPSKVTIAGISAGSSSAHLHMFSQMSKGLFHKVIAESGSAFSWWSAQDADLARSKAFRIGETLGIKTNDSKELLEFLRKASAKDLVEGVFKTVSEDEKHPLDGMFYLPVVERGDHTENMFMPEKPLDLIRKGQYNSVPVITGTTSREGLIIVPDYLKSRTWYESLDNDIEPVLNILLGLEKGTSQTKERKEKIRQFYFGDKKIGNETLNELVDMMGDILFYIGADKAAKEHVKATKDPMYYYQFSFIGEYVFLPGLDTFKGVLHGMDFMYFFDSSYHKRQSIDPEGETMKMGERLIRMWINFAKTGNPTPEDDSFIGVTWKPYTTNEANYLNIDSPLRMDKDLFKNRIDFWNSILKED